jgi:quercetin dioxygenase-like cupin family protein
MKRFPVLFAAALPFCALATHPQLPAAAVEATAAKPAPMLLSPGELKWIDVPEMGPGMQMAVLRGNPDKGGPLTMRAKFPDGFKIPPHWHPAQENFAVLQGTFMVGLGDKWDEAKLVALPPGGYASLPKGVRHFAVAKGETILELNAMGPFKTIWVDAPKKK